MCVCVCVLRNCFSTVSKSVADSRRYLHQSSPIRPSISRWIEVLCTLRWIERVTCFHLAGCISSNHVCTLEANNFGRNKHSVPKTNRTHISTLSNEWQHHYSVATQNSERLSRIQHIQQISSNGIFWVDGLSRHVQRSLMDSSCSTQRRTHCSNWLCDLSHLILFHGNHLIFTLTPYRTEQEIYKWIHDSGWSVREYEHSVARYLRPCWLARQGYTFLIAIFVWMMWHTTFECQHWFGRRGPRSTYAITMETKSFKFICTSATHCRLSTMKSILFAH